MADPKVIAQISGDDKELQATLARSGAAVRSFADKAAQDATRIQKAWADALGNLGRGLLAGATGLGAALGGASKFAADFEEQMRNVNSVAKQSEAELAQLTREVLKLPAALKVDQGPRELAAALYDINSAGFQAADGLKVLEAAARAATGGKAEAKTVADGLTTALRAYKASAEEAARFTDVMAKSVDLGKITMEELAGTIGNVATVAAQSGVSFEELNAALAVQTANGLKAGVAVDSTRQAILALVAPAAEARTVFDELQIKVGENEVRQRGFAAVMKDVVTAVGGNKEALRKLFGDVNALNAALILAGEGGAEFESALRGMLGAAGAVDQQLAQQRESLNVQLGILRANLESAAITVGQAFLPVIKAVASGLSELVAAFQRLPEGTQQFIAAASGVITAAGGIAGAVLALAPAFLKAKEAMLALNLSFTGLAGPIAIAIAAVTGLALAWQQNWGGIRQVAQDAVDTIRPLLEQGFTRIREVSLAVWEDLTSRLRFAWFRLMEDFKPALQELQAFFERVWPEISRIAILAVEVLGPIVERTLQDLVYLFEASMETIGQVWSVAWDLLEEPVAVAWDIVSGLVEDGLRTLRGAMEIAREVMEKDWQGAWDEFVEIIEDTGIGRGREAIRNVMIALLEEIAEFIGRFSKAGEDIVLALIEGVRRQEGQLRAAARGIRDAVEDELQPSFSDLLPKLGRAKAGVGVRPVRRQSETPAAPTTVPDIDLSTGKKKGRQPSAAEQEAAARAAFVAGLRELKFTPNSELAVKAGLDVDAPTCAITIRQGAKIAGLDLGVARRPVDFAKTQGLDQGPNFANSLFGPEVGRFFTDPSQLKPGDLVAFQNTMAGFGDGIITHVAAVSAIKDGIISIIDASRGAGQVVERDLLANFSPDQIFGFLEPAKFTGKAAGTSLGAELEEFRKNQKAFEEFTAPAGFGKQFQDLAQQRDLALQGAVSPEQKELVLQSYREQFSLIEAERQVFLDREIQDILEASTRQADAQIQAARETFEFRRALGESSLTERVSEIDQELEHFRGSEAERQALLLERHGLEQEVEQQRNALFDAAFTREQEFFDFQIALGTATQEQKLAWLQEELELFTGSVEARMALVEQIEGLQQELILKQANDAAQIAGQIEGTFTQFLTSTLSGQQSFSQAFGNLWKSLANIVIRQVAQMIVKLIGLEAILKKVLGLFGGLFGGPFAAAGQAAAGLIPLHSGGVVLSGGRIQSFHSGGVVGSGVLRTDEVLAKLQVGEMVLPRGAVQALRGSGGPGGVSVQVYMDRTSIRSEADIELISTGIGREVHGSLAGVF